MVVGQGRKCHGRIVCVLATATSRAARDSITRGSCLGGEENWNVVCCNFSTELQENSQSSRHQQHKRSRPEISRVARLLYAPISVFVRARHPLPANEAFNLGIIIHWSIMAKQYFFGLSIFRFRIIHMKCNVRTQGKTQMC